MEVLTLMNPWWKSGKVPPELSPPNRRAAFGELFADIKRAKPNLMLLISGLRRVGKSTLMYQSIERLLDEGVSPEGILYYSFDQGADEPLVILESYAELNKIDLEDDKIFVFLDEVQKLAGWSSKLKLLYDRFKNIKFILSGSGSFQLERAALKDLAGRHVTVKVDPLDFPEFLMFKNSKIDLHKYDLWQTEIRKAFLDYVSRPFPAIVNVSDDGIAKSVIKEMVIDKIIKDDIAVMFGGVNEQLLATLVDLFYGRPGMYVNYDELARDLKIGKKTLLQHIYYLEFSYLIRRVKNYRPSAKSSSRKMQRIYPFHWSLQFGWSGKTDYETIVASMLNAKYYWREGALEVDFIIKNAGIVPIEVKESRTLDRKDAKNVLEFSNKFKLDKGIIIYNGTPERTKYSKIEITAIPMQLLQLHKDLVQK